MSYRANVLSKQLMLIDQQTSRAVALKQWSELDRLKSQRHLLAKAAIKNGVKLISIPVADGCALYYEINRLQFWATFTWLYGGPDSYVSPWGRVVKVPIEQADELISKFNPNLI